MRKMSELERKEELKNTRNKLEKKQSNLQQEFTEKRQWSSDSKSRNELIFLTVTESMNVTAKASPYLLVLGGIDLKSLDPDVPGRCIFAQSTRSNSPWVHINVPLMQFIHHHGATFMNDKIYVIGEFFDETFASLLLNY